VRRIMKPNCGGMLISFLEAKLNGIKTEIEKG
jgi:hypothetical protein